jgi:hypothetical protein
MSLLITAPEMIASPASDLARIEATISAANAAAVASTTSVLAAGADEVSAAVSALFGAHAHAYQAPASRSIPVGASGLFDPGGRSSGGFHAGTGESGAALCRRGV